MILEMALPENNSDVYQKFVEFLIFTNFRT